ncbi:MAG: hypothetical protein DCF19_21175 [Pseudanabaena frigida]|uniref:histidine kinase n=1 Tax=Pseudanabaena frigida TaxID=945775 RepID=A0A2W4VZ51_9CYAN|nr:MAG: hypothetical protein DCF19_21175 [Pseudanabaena frigida]
MLHTLTTGYNLQLVVISVLIAILASYTALDLAGRVNAAQGKAKIGWLISGAATMGIGIWSMHFIGMLAFRLPISVHYNFWIVLASIIPAIAASGLALFLVSRPTLDWLPLLGGSLIMGGGIATMHYLGMAAMHTEAVITYDLRIVILSVVIAIAISFVALLLFFRLRDDDALKQTHKKILSAILMGAAIPTMHYTGLAAASFASMPNAELSELQTSENTTLLAATVGIGTLIILGVALLASLFDRRLAASKESERQTQVQAEQLRESEAQLRKQTQELQRTMQALSRTQTQLVQSEKMSILGQLVAGIAHEINNPVNFIHGNLPHVQNYAQDLLRFIKLYQHHYPEAIADIQNLADEIDLEFLQKDLLKTIQSMNVGTERIRQIVLSLRNFSRIDEAECKAVNIHEGIDNTIMILQHRLKANQDRPAIEVFKQYDASLPLVSCYPGQLNQVFMNILSNAIDALEEFRLKQISQGNEDYRSQITVRTSLIDSQWIQIEIADNGSGIPEEVQPKIFDPFFTTKPAGKGTGMGMSISYQIITEKHYGKLTCFSTLGEGSEFTIKIPIYCDIPK